MLYLFNGKYTIINLDEIYIEYRNKLKYNN